MEIPQPPSDAKARARNQQLMVAGLLSFCLAGVLLVAAADEPGNAARWIALVAWVVVASAGNVYAWRRYYRAHPPEPWPGRK